MVERARLESVYTVLSRIEGSNPSLSANQFSNSFVLNIPDWQAWIEYEY